MQRFAKVSLAALATAGAGFLAVPTAVLGHGTELGMEDDHEHDDDAAMHTS